MTAISKRIVQIACYYKVQKPSEFSKKTGFNHQTATNYLNGRSPTSDNLGIIQQSFDEINPEWLLTGKGEMLRESREEQGTKIPLYDGVVVGGFSSVADMASEIQPIEYINAGDWFRDATAAMRVHGDSMAPLYKSGSIIAMREVQDKMLIIFGQDYLIETSEYRVIKRVQKSEIKQHWLLRSTNEEQYQDTGKLIHEPFDIHVDSITRLYRVLGNVTRTESSRIVYNSNK